MKPPLKKEEKAEEEWKCDRRVNLFKVYCMQVWNYYKETLLCY
jgi:hypothetical protein